MSFFRAAAIWAILLDKKLGEKTVRGITFLLEVHGREAPMHPQMNWNEHQPVVENIHFSRPPLHSRVTLLHDFGVEECVGCVDLD